MDLLKMVFDNVFHLGMICLIGGLSIGEGEGGTPAPATPAAAGTENNAGTADPSTPAQQGTEGAQAGGQPAANASSQEVFDWVTDKRREKQWKANQAVVDYVKKNPSADKFIAEVYKSYRNMEKVYDPLKLENETFKGQFEALSKIAKEEGIELTPEIIKAVLTENKTWKDPNNPVISRAKYFSEWLDNPLYKDKVVSMFSELENAEMERQYPNMNAETRKTMIELKEFKRSVEEKERRTNIQAQEKDNTEKGLKSLKKAEDYAKVKGFAFTDDIRNQVVEQMRKENIPHQFAFETFLSMFNEALDKAAADKVKAAQLQGLNKNKDSIILPAKKGSEGVQKGKAAQAVDAMKDGFRKALGGRT